jgi:hypothetical protein
MQWKTLAVALALSAQDVYGAPAEVVEKRQNSAALMRFECSKLVIDRLDPLVQPGQAPSAHLVRTFLTSVTLLRLRVFLVLGIQRGL